MMRLSKLDSSLAWRCGILVVIIRLTATTGFALTAWIDSRAGCLQKNHGWVTRELWKTSPPEYVVGAGKSTRILLASSVEPAAEEPRGINASTDDPPDYYSLLGLTMGASPSEIKDAYRRVARETHPDTAGGGDGARDRFEQLTAAYQILSDPGRKSTYDQGLAMRRFVNKVKAGNWGKTLRSVASFGAAATSVGVTVGVAAAQPLAEGVARGLVDVTVSGLQSLVEETDSIAREQQSVKKTKESAERKLATLARKSDEALAEAAEAEKMKETRKMEQREWNATLEACRKSTFETNQLVLENRALVNEATVAMNELSRKEREANEALRKSRLARDTFGQESSTARRRVVAAQSAAAVAERRLAEALQVLEDARRNVDAECQQADKIESRRSQVLAEEEAADEALRLAREGSAEGKSVLSERQVAETALKTELRDKDREEGRVSARVKELENSVEAAAARASRLRKSAEEFDVAARQEAKTVRDAVRREARLQAEAAAAHAAAEAARAATQQEKAQREREEAAAAAEAAVRRAREAETAAGLASATAVAAAEAARRAQLEARGTTERKDRTHAAGRLSTSFASGSVEVVDKAEPGTEDRSIEVVESPANLVEGGIPDVNTGRDVLDE